MSTLLTNQSLAERVVRDGFKQFERSLKRQSIDSPATPGFDLLFDYGTALNPELVLSFYTSSGNLTLQASECYCQDEEKVSDAWHAYKQFIRIGGHPITAERRLETYSPKTLMVTFDDKSAINIINDRATGLPMLSIINWQTGLLDVTDLKGKDDVGFYLEQRLERIGYRWHVDNLLLDMGRIFRHPDSAMAPVLVDWNTKDTVKLLLFPADQPALRIDLTQKTLESMDAPVLDLRRQPTKTTLFDYPSGCVPYCQARSGELMMVD